MKSITERAMAKLNLSLDVLDKRPDGYHNMLMVMQTVSLWDDVTVTLTNTGAVTVKTDLHYLPDDERNIAYKAARAFLDRAASGAGAEIIIKKRIPVCAGMGGGSADGAAVLRAMNTLTVAGMTTSELQDLGAELGSDIPFCIFGGTALAEGRGELLTAVAPIPDCHIVICKPRASASTPALFQRLDAVGAKYHPDTAGIVRSLEGKSLRGVAQRMFNVFDAVLPTELSEVHSIQSQLLDCGALGAVMTGTGSAAFGVFDDEAAAKAAYDTLSSQYKDTFLTTPCKN